MEMRESPFHALWSTPHARKPFGGTGCCNKPYSTLPLCLGLTRLGWPSQLVHALGAAEFLPARQSASDAFAQLCAAVPSACVDILDAICGADDENFNLTRLPEYFVNTPAGEAAFQGFWAQVIRMTLCTHSYSQQALCCIRIPASNPAGMAQHGRAEAIGCSGSRAISTRSHIHRMNDGYDRTSCVAGTSVKTVIHWAQAVRSPRPWFRRFDYGVWCLDWRLQTQVRSFAFLLEEATAGLWICAAAVLSTSQCCRAVMTFICE